MENRVGAGGRRLNDRPPAVIRALAGACSDIEKALLNNRVLIPHLAIAHTMSAQYLGRKRLLFDKAYRKTAAASSRRTVMNALIDRHESNRVARSPSARGNRSLVDRLCCIAVLNGNRTVRVRPLVYFAAFACWAVLCVGGTAAPDSVAARGWMGVIAPTVVCAAETERELPTGAVESGYFGIQVVDAESGRGVPLVELRTVNQASYWTDSAGWAAVNEPDMTGREVFFHVGGPGYEHPADGFGNRGVRLKLEPGRTATIRVRRTNIAERLYRITGQGIYRDSLLLGRPAPASALKRRGGVMGQDSVQAVPYRGRLFWLWGDTSLPDYPLGNFQTTAAFAPLPSDGGYSPQEEIPLEYLLDEKRPDRVRAMCPWNEPGMIWLFGLLTIDDPQGRETLVAHYSRQKSLAERAEHGLARFDDATGRFVKLAVFDEHERWRHPRGNAVRVRETEGDYFYFVEQWAATRVPARWEALLDPAQYEAFRYDPAAADYRWQKAEPPFTPEDERRLLAAGKMALEEARLLLRDSAGGRTIVPHRASIQWNDYRKRWIMIFTQYGDKQAESFLGEVWYSEAEQITGPWKAAVKIASHPKYSFYNPRQHVFFDEAGGRVVYFEGTYTEMFSGNPVATPRYDYNQLLYRLNLDDPRLRAARAENAPR